MNKWKFNEYMDKAGYTQKTLAAMLPMSKNTLNSKVNGKTDFKASEIVAVCQALEITDPNTVVEIFLPNKSQ